MTFMVFSNTINCISLSGVRDLRKIEGAMEDIINRTPREFREKYEELWKDKDSYYLGASQQEEPNPFDVCLSIY